MVRKLERYCKIKDSNLSFWVGEFVSWWVWVGDECINWACEFVSWWVYQLISPWVYRLTNLQADESANWQANQLTSTQINKPATALGLPIWNNQQAHRHASKVCYATSTVESGRGRWPFTPLGKAATTPPSAPRNTYSRRRVPRLYPYIQRCGHCNRVFRAHDRRR